MSALAQTPALVEESGRRGGGAAALASGSLVVGVLNYVTSLVAVHLLAPGAFSSAAAAQAVLLVVGTAATASVPWVVAQVLERPGATSRDAREVVWFSLVVNLGQGVVAAVVVVLVAQSFLGLGGSLAAAAAAVFVFVATTPAGWLQGRRRYAQLALLRVAEAVVKVAVVVVALGAGAGPTGVVVGIGAGAAAVLVVGLVLCREDLAVVPGALRLRSLWRTCSSLVAVQAQVAAVVALDVLLVERLARSEVEAGSYQAAAVLGKVPLFVAGALAAVEFGRLTHQRGAAAEPTGGAEVAPGARSGSLGALLLLCVPFTALALTVPPQVVDLVLPARYSAVTSLLPWAAALGSALAVLTLVASCRVALASPRTGRALLLLLVLATVVGATAGLTAGAAGTAGALAVVVAVGVVLLLRPLLPMLRPGRPAVLTAVALGAAGGATGLGLADRPVAWAVAAAAVGGVALVLALRASRVPSVAAAPDRRPGGVPPRRPTVLHLAFEDHRRPGAGGGSRRSFEVNTRLAADFDITVVATTWRGARDRVEDGVTYRHVGLPGGYLVEVLTYFALLPLVVRRSRADVVVEDFAAPFSTIGVQRWARQPVVGVVQWLNARDKAEQYHLPLHLVERDGVRRHTHLLAVSDGVAEQLRVMNPAAQVRVLPNGVEPAAFAEDGPRGEDVVFLGRLEIAQKGLDVLLRAWALVRDGMPGRLLLAGDGPDEEDIRRLVDRLALGDSVRLLGRVDRDERLALLRRARLTVMPSRFETFGLVALESLAVGTPVLASDIDCLRDVVLPGPGALVPVDDVDALAAQMLAMAGDAGLADRYEGAARSWAAGFSWDAVAATQGEVLRSTL